MKARGVSQDVKEFCTEGSNGNKEKCITSVEAALAFLASWGSAVESLFSRVGENRRHEQNLRYNHPK
jgi:hypothetical protein